MPRTSRKSRTVSPRAVTSRSPPASARSVGGMRTVVMRDTYVTARAGRLAQEVLQWLYREDRFCKGTLPIGGRTVGPSRLRLPMLAVVNPTDEIAPAASVLPFIQAMPEATVRVLEYPGEIGVGLQHLGILVGRRAYARVWPEIVSWLRARC